MNGFIEKTWNYLKTTTVIAITLIVIGGFYQSNVYVLGLYLFSGWLLTPLVTYWLLGNHDTPITFMIRVYPKFLRQFISYGWLSSLVILTLIWLYLLIHVNYS